MLKTKRKTLKQRDSFALGRRRNAAVVGGGRSDQPTNKSLQGSRTSPFKNPGVPSQQKNTVRASTLPSKRKLLSFANAPLVLSKEDAERHLALAGKSGRRYTPVQSARSFVKLCFVSNYTCTSGASAGPRGLSFALSPNSAFVPDILAQGPNTTTPGFSTMSIKYASYIVHGYDAEMVFSNQTAAVPTVVCVCHSNSALGVTGSSGVDIAIQSFAALRPDVNFMKEIGGGAGDSNCTYKRFMSIDQVTGESSKLPGYKSVSSGSPSLLTYLVFGTQNVTPTTSTSVSVMVKLTMFVEFLDYIDTLTSFVDRTNLGDFSPLMCAGCTYLSQLPDYEPCSCGCVISCTTCKYTIPCMPARRARNCVKKDKLAPVILPRRNSAGVLVPYKPKVVDDEC